MPGFSHEEGCIFGCESLIGCCSLETDSWAGWLRVHIDIVNFDHMLRGFATDTGCSIHFLHPLSARIFKLRGYAEDTLEAAAGLKTLKVWPCPALTSHLQNIVAVTSKERAHAAVRE